METRADSAFVTFFIFFTMIAVGGLACYLIVRFNAWNLPRSPDDYTFANIFLGMSMVGYVGALIFFNAIEWH